APRKPISPSNCTNSLVFRHVVRFVAVLIIGLAIAPILLVLLQGLLDEGVRENELRGSHRIVGDRNNCFVPFVNLVAFKLNAFFTGSDDRAAEALASGNRYGGLDTGKLTNGIGKI